MVKAAPLSMVKPVVSLLSRVTLSPRTNAPLAPEKVRLLSLVISKPALAPDKVTEVSAVHAPLMVWVAPLKLPLRMT